jgi:hypothetical protein
MEYSSDFDNCIAAPPLSVCLLNPTSSMQQLRLLPERSMRMRCMLSMPKRSIISSSRHYGGKEERASSYRIHPRRTLANCPTCNSPLTTPLPACSNCGYIADVPSALKADYFSLFGLPSLVPTGDASGSNVDARNVFSVNPQELRNRFLRMQKLCHPDRWAQKGQVRLSSRVSRSKSNKSPSFCSLLYLGSCRSRR